MNCAQSYWRCFCTSTVYSKKYFFSKIRGYFQTFFRLRKMRLLLFWTSQLKIFCRCHRHIEDMCMHFFTMANIWYIWQDLPDFLCSLCKSFYKFHKYNGLVGLAFRRLIPVQRWIIKFLHQSHCHFWRGSHWFHVMLALKCFIVYQYVPWKGFNNRN